MVDQVTPQTPLIGPTPDTVSSLRMRRALAQALLKQGLDSTPIRSPWQGIGRVIQAGMGGYESGSAEAEERRGLEQAGATSVPNFGSPAAAAPQQPPPSYQPNLATAVAQAGQPDTTGAAPPAQPPKSGAFDQAWNDSVVKPVQQGVMDPQGSNNSGAFTQPGPVGQPGGATPVQTQSITPASQAATGKPIIDPRLLPKTPIITHEQVVAIQANPMASPQQKEHALQMYNDLQQPGVMPVTGGNVLYSKANPNIQHFIPTLEKSNIKVGGVEVPAYSTIDPYGTRINQLPTTGQGAGSLEGLQAQDVQHQGQVARVKTFAEEAAKATASPLTEVMKESKTAPQALQQLNIIEDVARTEAAKKTTTGLAGEPMLKMRQTVNGLLGYDALGDTSGPEVIKKSNAALASAATQAMTARGTQFDFKVNMENQPGNLMNSWRGTLYLTDINKQIHRQNLELAQLASDPNNQSNWAAVQKQYYASHPIVNPLTGNPMGVAGDTKQQLRAGTPEVGSTHNGFKYKGGDPADQKSWAPVK